MIDSLIKLGQELLAEEEKQLGDKKEALIRLLVDKSLLFKQQAEQTRGGKDKKTKKPRELTLARIILDPKTKSAKIDDKWRRQITQSTLQEYKYVFEYMHMTRGRPRLTFKDVKSLNPEADRDEPKSGIDGLLQRIDELERAGKATDSMKELRGLLTPFYRKNFDVKNGEADLFTVVVDDGKSLIELAKTKGYRDFLYADIRLEHQLASGVCSACQEKTDVVPDPDFPRGSLLKMYITDQPGFISNIPSDNAKKTKALLKNFPLCPNCLTHLLIGHQFIITTSSLSSSIYENKLKAFVIPYSRIRAKRIKEWLSLYEARWVFEAVTKIERDLEEWDEQNYYITIIFGSGERANFRFYGAIREVPLTRLSLYEREIRQLKSELANCLALEQIESFPKLDMGSLGNLIPLRTAVNRVVEIEPLFSFFKAILKGEPIPPNVIGSTCLTYAKIILYEKMRGYTVKPGKSRKVGFCTGVIAYKLLDTVIRRMNADMQRIEIPELRELPGHIKEIMNTLGLVEWQRPLFLLGYVMGEIGARQIAERAEKGEFPPIIRKISFDGMNRERVVRLSVEVSEAMKNYGVTGGDALLAWSYAQLGIQENIVRLNDPVLNVFHILSGYAYATLLHIGRKKEQAEEVKSDE